MRGNQPINLDVLCETRDTERRALFNLFMRDNELDPDERRVLEMHDQTSSLTEQAAQCIRISMSWLKCLSTEGNRRTRDHTRDYQDTFGPVPVSIAAD